MRAHNLKLGEQPIFFQTKSQTKKEEMRVDCEIRMVIIDSPRSSVFSVSSDGLCRLLHSLAERKESALVLNYLAHFHSFAIYACDEVNSSIQSAMAK